MDTFRSLRKTILYLFNRFPNQLISLADRIVGLRKLSNLRKEFLLIHISDAIFMVKPADAFQDTQ